MEYRQKFYASGAGFNNNSYGANANETKAMGDSGAKVYSPYGSDDQPKLNTN